MDKIKYPRRQFKTIRGQKYNLSEPDMIRSKTMSRIPSKKTSIERLLASALRLSKIKYRSGHKRYGKPDFILLGTRIVVFCDGAFWHGYNYSTLKITNNKQFWFAKIKSNMIRDAQVNFYYNNRNWIVLRFWEHDLRKNISQCLETIQCALYEDGKNSV